MGQVNSSMHEPINVFVGSSSCVREDRFTIRSLESLLEVDDRRLFTDGVSVLRELG